MVKRDDILYFDKFLAIPHLVHGFSTRAFGDMRPSHEGSKVLLDKFAEALQINPRKVVRMNQTHSANIAVVGKGDAGKVIADTDGILTGEKDLFLSVITADCIPLLFYDSARQVVGAVHAGWRGIYAEIIKQTVDELVKNGSKATDIVVGVGPSIRVCCYEVSEELVGKFAGKFPKWSDYVIKREGKFFLDLALLANYQLRSLGITDTNIEDAGICTKDSPDNLYSCRREGKEFGEFVGVIGIRV